MTAAGSTPTTGASIGEQIAAAIELACYTNHPIINESDVTELCPSCNDAATIARNFTLTVDGAAVDEARAESRDAIATGIAEVTRAQNERDTATARINAAMAIHKPYSDQYCRDCRQVYPCRTARELGADQ